MRARILFLTVALLWPLAAEAQNVTVIGPVTPGDCAQFSSTTIIKDAGTACGGGGSGSPGGTPGQIQWNSAGSFAGFTASGDATINTSTGAVTVTKTNGTAFGALATLTPGTGVATALGINVGSAGAPVLFNGALGTPSSGVATNLTGLPISTGLAGAGTGALTALAVNVGSAGSFVVNGGALGSPSSAGTIPAFTLGGTIAGGGNQINNAILGNVSPQPANVTNFSATGSSVFGTNATLPGGGSTLVGVNGNTGNAIPAMSGFGPQLVVVGPDGNRGAMALQSYMQSTAGNESSYLAFTARGTMASPASIQSGDSVGEFFAHGATTTGGFQFLHNAGAGFTMVATDNFLVGAAGEQINVYTTPTGTGSAALNSTFNASGGLTIASGEPALFLNKNAASTPPGIPSAFGSNALLRMIEADTVSPIFAIQSFSTGFNPPTLLGLAARGTGASTTATQSGDTLMDILAYGYATSSSAGYVVTGGAGFQINATNNYTTTTAGSRVDIVATPAGTATAAVGASVGAGFMVGTLADPGAGSLIAAKLIQGGNTTVGALPACSGTLRGARYFVTDANSSTYHATATAGGANNVGVTCDGTNWYIS